MAVTPVTIIHGDASTLPLPDASVDAIITDPPYELGFMGRKWDSTGVAYDVETWREAWRVLKPGAHLLAFGGSRTWHRLACAIEDAGFELRDSIAWLYGSGFPKSHDVSKAIDKATDAAKQWQGWGTALKPGFEPIVVARKPLIGTVAANVIAHGTGAINIDACRIATNDVLQGSGKAPLSFGGANHRPYHDGEARPAVQHAAGRWPTNVVFSHGDACADGCVPGCQVAELDAQSGVLKSGLYQPHHQRNVPRLGHGGTYGNDSGGQRETPTYGDSGGASRFFPTFRYQAKAPTRERPRVDGVAHPTVKPLELMRWLCKLVTPPGGVILDPFAGSGTTGEAALLEGFEVILIEREAAYLQLIRERVG